MFEARDFNDQWKQITGQVGCSFCHTALPMGATYGNGKHAVVDSYKRCLHVICDQCYVNTIETEGRDRGYDDRVELEREELARRQFIEEQLTRQSRQPKRKQFNTKAAFASQRRVNNNEIDYGPFIREAKKLGKALWEDLTGTGTGNHRDEGWN